MATRAVRRQEERVTPLELFFDLVFVLAITQCTALMAAEHSWEGLAKGLLVLAALWWSWVGYSWLTSVLDPEEGLVRLAMFAAIAAFLVLALCIPEAFDDQGVTFAVAYAVVRVAHIALFLLASRDDPTLRSSVVAGLAGSTAIGVTLLGVASQLDGGAQGAVWLAAIALDVAGPLFFGSEGWEIVPGHFAERHGLIVIIALGESIVAIGVGAGSDLDAGVIAAAVVGVAIAALLWWAYFDVVMHFAARNLAAATVGKEQNELARDAYSLLHFPMVAGIVLVALGLKDTLAEVDEPLDAVAATALLGGVALYLLAHVAFAWRDHHAVKVARVIAAAAVLAVLPAAGEVDAIATASAAATILAVLITYETRRYAADRDRIRHGDHVTA
jgi:low temperature requirement protein LtrA